MAGTDVAIEVAESVSQSATVEYASDYSGVNSARPLCCSQRAESSSAPWHRRREHQPRHGVAPWVQGERATRQDRDGLLAIT